MRCLRIFWVVSAARSSARLLPLLLLLVAGAASAGAQREEALSFSVASGLHRSIDAVNAPRLVFDDAGSAQRWLAAMSRRLAARVPDDWMRRQVLTTVQYEARRAGLDPQLVLGLIDVESGFRKYAVSTAGARGLMQVMPFWVRSIGDASHNLFDLKTNLRYGCTILRYYLDRENGDVFRALGRYNGSLGEADYPERVLAAWRGRWQWP